jgi:hypothetical protein
MKLNLVTKILSFNPTNLMNEALRRRLLLRNPDVIDIIRRAYTWGQNSEVNRLYDNAPGADPFTLENLLEELKK